MPTITVKNIIDDIFIARKWPISKLSMTISSKGVENEYTRDSVLEFYTQVIIPKFTKGLIKFSDEITIELSPYYNLPDTHIGIYPFTSDQVSYCIMTSELFTMGVGLTIASCFDSEKYTGPKEWTPNLELDPSAIWAELRYKTPGLNYLTNISGLSSSKIDYLVKYTYPVKYQGIFISAMIAKYLFSFIKDMWIKTYPEYTVLTNYNPKHGLSSGWDVPFYFDLPALSLPDYVYPILSNDFESEYIPITDIHKWIIHDEKCLKLSAHIEKFVESLASISNPSTLTMAPRLGKRDKRSVI